MKKDNKPQYNSLYSHWVSLGFFVLLFFASCDPCLEKIPESKRGICNSIDTLEFPINPDDTAITATYKEKYFKLAYRCNQLIFDPSAYPHNDEDVRKFLRKNCFELKRQCNCGPGFELWEYPSVEGIDVGTSVAQGPRVGGIGKEFFYNLVFDLEKQPFAIDKGDSLIENPTLLKCIPGRSIKLAIVDSGVDPGTSAAENCLRHGNWNAFNLQNLCIQNTNSNGLTLVNGYNLIEPNDTNGHGTSVNGVLVGESVPNIDINIPLQFLNVRITSGHTKTGDLFDALCGLYYALEQEPKIINISWGFEYIVTTGDAKNVKLKDGIESLFGQFFEKAKYKKVLIVAGIGNDSRVLNNLVKFYPGGLACCHDNVISVGSSYDNDQNLATFQPGTFSSFSNCSSISDNMTTLIVPGQRIKTVFPKYISVGDEVPDPLRASGYAFQSGTSFAAPLVSRLAALMLSNNQTLVPIKIKNFLLASTTNGSVTINGVIREYRALDVWQVANNSCNQMY